jgi:hypothetical protein
MNTEFRPSGDFVARVMERIEACETANSPKAAALLTSRTARFLLACGAPLLLLLRAAPVF